MCGIAGIVAPEPLQAMPETLKAFGESLRHRGPDDLGYMGWSGRGAVQIARHADLTAGSRVGFAHRRLAVLDLSDAARQPMATADGRYCIVFSGAIYNYLELRQELAKLGYTFNSRSDTEVLLAAYAQWGPQALNRLVGMFALAILDTAERTVFLARDFFGIKPLYHTIWQGRLAFASEIKALLTLRSLRCKAKPGQIYDYLRFGLTDHRTETMFDGINQLAPAHYMQVPLDGPYQAESVRYWQIDAQPLDISFPQAAARLREMFLESIKLHLRSDVPVGVALSGGVDSSAILMGMSKIRGGGRHVRGGGDRIHAFTHIADGELSEERWGDLVARQAQADIHKVNPKAHELLEDLDELIAVQDEPFGGTSIYAQMRVFRLAASQGIKVMLDGQGADELLAGYRPYIAARVLSLLRGGSLGRAMCFLWRCSKLPGVSSVRMFLRAAGLALPGGLQRPARFLAGQSMMPRWMSSHWFGRAGVRGQPPWRSTSRYALLEQLEQSVTTNALPMLLRYEDRNSMAHSVESRVPFLTPALVNFLLSLPEQYLLSPDAVTKAVFREAMKGIVPDAILARRDKIGFATDEREWLLILRPWVNNVLNSDAAENTAPLDIRAVRRAWRKMSCDGRRFDLTIWRAVNLIRWGQCYNVSFEA